MIEYSLQGIINIIRNRYFVSYQKSNYLADMSSGCSPSHQGGFEDMSCEWADVLNILKIIKDKNKKGVFLCKVCGIPNNIIIELFKISKSTVYNYCNDVFQLLANEIPDKQV